MFQNLYNFGYHRRGLEIAGFYIAYLLGTIIASAIVGMTVGALFGGNEARINSHADSITASIVVLVVSFLIIKQKKFSGILFTLLPLGAALLCQIATPILALFIPTFLASMAPHFQFTPPPKRGDDGANEDLVKKQQMEDLPPPTPLGDNRR